MASTPPKKNTAFSFEVALPSQAGAIFQVNPTLAAGDVKVSKDGGAFANITTLPTAISSGAYLTVALSATEMNADRIVVMFSDAAGAQWCDVSCEIFTVTNQIDDLALQSSVLGIGSSTGAALSTDATTDNTAGGISGVTSGTTFVGSQSGTFADAMAQDSVYHQITHAANAIDIVYQFNIGAGSAPTVCVWIGYLTGNNDQFTISTWNHVSGAWDSMATITGQSGTVNIKHDCPLFPRYVGTSVAELGKVYMRLHCTGQTSPVLNTDQIYVSYAVTSSDIAAVKAKTDSLTFTVAGNVDANVQSVNDVTVTGVGSEADPWGP